MGAILLCNAVQNQTYTILSAMPGIGMGCPHHFSRPLPSGDSLRHGRCRKTLGPTTPSRSVQSDQGSAHRIRLAGHGRISPVRILVQEKQESLEFFEVKGSKTRRVATVHGLAGDWSIFRRKIAFCQSTPAENMDLSPSRGPPQNLGQSPVNGYIGEPRHASGIVRLNRTEEGPRLERSSPSRGLWLSAEEHKPFGDQAARWPFSFRPSSLRPVWPPNRGLWPLRRGLGLRSCP
jgi:hypothetical protein